MGTLSRSLLRSLSPSLFTRLIFLDHSLFVRLITTTNLKAVVMTNNGHLQRITLQKYGERWGWVTPNLDKMSRSKVVIFIEERDQILA